MSHVAKISLKIKSLHALRQACKRLGLELVEGQKTYKWYGRWVNDYHGQDAAYKHGVDPKDYGKCDHAIRVPGNKSAYEVGVIGNKDGSYSLIWDNWQGGHGLAEKIGTDGGKLNQSYSLEAAKIAANKQGYSFYEQQKQDGSIDLVINC